MSSLDRIKVFVLHHDPLVHAGLVASFLHCEDVDVINPEQPASSTSPAPVPLDGRSVDIVVADYQHGVRVAASLRGIGIGRATPKVLVVTANDCEWEIRGALESGVSGYLLVGCPLDDFAVAVRSISRGMRFFSPGVSQRLAESLSNEPLTTREEEVLRLVVDGHCNKIVANHLGIAVGTVKSHLKAIFDKLRVETRTQAVVAVSRRGLLRSRTVGNGVGKLPKSEATRRDKSVGSSVFEERASA